MRRQRTLTWVWSGRPVAACAWAAAWMGFASWTFGADGLLSVDTVRPQVGRSITVTVALGNTPPYATWGALVRFDPAKLRFTAQTAGSVTNFVADSRSAAEINASGEVRMGGYCMANMTQSGPVARVSFQSLATGTTTVATENKSAGELSGNVLLSLGGGGVLPSVPSPLTITIAATSGPALTISSTAIQGDKCILKWTSQTGKTYDIQRTANLANGFGATEATGLAATAPMNTHTADTAHTVSGFFRIVEK